jgi:repressor LexA
LVVKDKILAFLRSFIAEHGYSPTVREIAEAVGLSTSGTYHHLEALRAEGAITGGPGARTWRLAA